MMYSLSPTNMTRSTPVSLNLRTALLIAAAPAVADEKPVVQSIDASIGALRPKVDINGSSVSE